MEFNIDTNVSKEELLEKTISLLGGDGLIMKNLCENVAINDLKKKILELENKIIDLTNDVNLVRSNKPELFNLSCKLCSRAGGIFFQMNCLNNSDLYFLVCEDCKKKNEEDERIKKYNKNTSLSNQNLFLNKKTG